MNRTKLTLIGINLVLLLGYFNWSVVSKENTLEKGQLVLLKLVPVDPRSLMQGDYMQLNYELTNDTDSLKLSKRGYCIVRQDASGVAKRIRFQKELSPLKEGEFAIRYFSKSDRYAMQVRVGAEAYFFEEGKGKRFEKAEYGGLRVDDEGNSVLVGLYDGDRHLIR